MIPPPKNDIPPWLRQLLSSSMADSVFNVVGRPAKIGSEDFQSTLGPTVLGAYRGNEDSIMMQPNQNLYSNEDFGYDPRSVFIHEMGHKFADKAGIPMKAFTVPSDADPRGLAALNDYYRYTPEDGFAQAFLIAMNALSNNAKKVSPTVREDLGKAEGFTPGMGQILAKILEKSSYKSHPLQEFFRPVKKEKK